MQSLEDCLKTLTEVIQSQLPTPRDPTPTEYFALILSTLSSGSLDPSVLPTMLRVLLGVITSTNVSIVRSQFKQLATILLNILKQNNEDSNLIMILLNNIGKLLLLQEATEPFWSNSLSLQCFNALLAFSDDTNVRIRRISHENIVNLLTSHMKSTPASSSFSNTSSIKSTSNSTQCLALRSYFTDFCIGVFKNTTRSSYRRAHCIVILLESVLFTIPFNMLKKLNDEIVKLHACQLPRLTSAIYRMFDATFQNPLFLTAILTSINATNSNQYNKFQIILSVFQNLILNSPQNTHDVETYCYYYSALASGYVMLANCIIDLKIVDNNDNSSRTSYITLITTLYSRVFLTLLEGCESEFNQIHSAAASSMKRILMMLVKVRNYKNENVNKLWMNIINYRDNSFKTADDILSNLTFKKLVATQVVSDDEFLLAYKNNLETPGVSEETKSTFISNIKNLGVIPFSIIVLYQTLDIIEKILQLKYQHSWIFMLDVIKTFMDSIKGFEGLKDFLCSKIIKKLVELVKINEEGVIEIENLLRNNIVDLLNSSMNYFNYSVIFSHANFFSVNDEISSSNEVIKGKSGNIIKIKNNGKTIELNEWLVELVHKNLKDTTRSNELNNFLIYILPQAGKLHKLISDIQDTYSTASFVPNNVQIQIKILRNLLIQLWSLLPAFVSNGIDSITDFTDSVPKVITIGLTTYDNENYPEFKFFVTQTFDKLISIGLTNDYNKKKFEILNQFSGHVVPVLLNYLETIDAGDGRYREVLHALSEWLKVTNEALLGNICKKLIQAVLQSTHFSSNLSDDASTYMSVLLAMIPVMPAALVSIVYRTVRPLMVTDDSVSLGTQKRAYSLLVSLLEYHQNLVLSEINRFDLLNYLSESLLSAHVSTRSMRLKCIELLLSNLPPEESESVIMTACEKLLSEVLLCLKDSNKKTRDAASNLIFLFSKLIPSVTFQMKLIVGLGAETPTLRAASIISLSMHLSSQNKIVNNIVDDEDSDDDDDEEDEDEDEKQAKESKVSNYISADIQAGLFPQLVQNLTSLLPSLFLLFSQNNNEQTKALLSLVKTLVSISPRSILEPILSGLTQGFCEGPGPLKPKFVNVTRSIVRKLMKKFTEDELRTVIPQSDIALLDYLIKEKRKTIRKKSEKNKKKDEEDQMDESDNDYDEEGNVINNKEDYRLSKTYKVKGILARDMIKQSAQENQEIEDLLEEHTATLLKKQELKKQSANTGKNMQANKKLSKASDLIEGDVESNEPDHDNYDIEVKDGKVVVKKKDVDPSSSTTPKGNSTLDAKNNNKISAYSAYKKEKSMAKKAFSHLKAPGIEYKSSKGKGDVWRKGVKLQPHAYLPLDPRLLSKKHKDVAIKQFSHVVGKKKK